MTELALKVELLLDGESWTDVTSDVIVGSLTCTSGITSDNSELDRVAGVGSFSFELKNSTANSAGLLGYYSPGHTNCVTGFAAGCKVRIGFNYWSGLAFTTKWYGEIAPGGIKVIPGSNGPRRVQVTCYDWMYHANNHRLNLVQYTTNKRADETLDLVIANMNRQPADTYFDTGSYTFQSVFDSVRTYTTAMAEFQKICLSERGYLYLKHNRTYDEVLVFENSSHRDSITATNYVAAPPNLCSTLLDEDGSKILDEDGSYLLSDDVLSISLNNSMCEMEARYGANLANRITYTVYPKEEFSDTLCTTQNRISIPAGTTKTNIKLTYTDPDAKASKVTAKTVTSLVKGTHYTLNSASDGSGTNLNASLTLDYTAGAESLMINSAENASATDGYLYLTAPGTGIRIYEPLSSITEDSTSEGVYGLQELVYNAPYQNDPVVAESTKTFVLANYKDPFPEIRAACFWATDDTRKQLFLDTDVGTRVNLVEEVSGLSEDYFVQGWEFQIAGTNAQGGSIVKWKWYLRRAALDVNAS